MQTASTIKRMPGGGPTGRLPPSLSIRISAGLCGCQIAVAQKRLHAGEQRGGPGGRGAGRRLVMNMAPRWRAAWWPRRSRGGTAAGAEHGSTLASSVVAEDRGVPGVVFETRYLHEIGRLATTLLASVERCSRPEMPPKIGPLATTLASSVVAEVREVISAAVAREHRQQSQFGRRWEDRLLHNVGANPVLLLGADAVAQRLRPRFELGGKTETFADKTAFADLLRDGTLTV